MAQKRALILGASGETGRQLLDQLARSQEVAGVVSVGRRAIQLPDDDEAYRKVEQRVVDFDNLDANAEAFGGVDAAFCCLGTTRAKAGKEGFVRVDHDYVLAAAERLKAAGCREFHLLTSKGSSPDSWFLYPATKGRVEQAVRRLDFDRLRIYRPGLLLCDRAEPRLGESVLRFLSGFVDRSHAFSVPTATVAGAMLRSFLSPEGGDTEILEHHDIVRVGAEQT